MPKATSTATKKSSKTAVKATKKTSNKSSGTKAVDLLGDEVISKAVTPKKAAPAKAAVKKAARKKVVADPQGLYIAPDDYKKAIDGLMDQGLDHADAVATLKVGIRQANGRPVPLELQMDVVVLPVQGPSDTVPLH